MSEIFEMHAWRIEFFASAALATLYLNRSFGTSAQNRSYTTAQRYYAGFTVLATAHLIVFFSFAATLRFIGEGNLAHIQPAQSWVRALLSSPSWMAFVTLFCLPRLGLSRVDGALWRFCKQLAGIPATAEDLRQRLMSSRLEAAPELSRDIQLNLRRRGQDFYRLQSRADTSLGSLWSRASILMHHLGKWESGRADGGPATPVRLSQRWPDRLSRGRYTQFMYNNQHRHESLRRRYDFITFKAGRVFDQIDRLRTITEERKPATDDPENEWGSLQNMVEARVYEKKETSLAPVMSASRMMLTDLRNDMDMFLRDACGLVARGVLLCERTSKKREARLKQLGFSGGGEEEPSFDSVVYAFVVLVGVLFVGFSALGIGSEGGGDKKLSLVAMISLQQLVAISCAVFPKVFFGFANVNLHGRRPYGFFLGAGLVSATVAFVLGLGFRYLRLSTWEKTRYEALESVPWLLMSFTIAGVMAFLVQDDMASIKLSAHRERARDALVLGLALCLTSLAVLWLLPMAQAQAQAMFPGQLPGDLPPPAGPIVMSLILGGSIGWIVPYSFRVRLHDLHKSRRRRATRASLA